jgi:hypothetical protein
MLNIKRLLASLSMVIMFAMMASMNQAGGRLPPVWKASDVVAKSDLVAVVDGPCLENVYPRVRAPEVFGREGPARIFRFTLVEALHGNVAPGAEVIVVRPPTHMKGHAPIIRGESLLFLRKLELTDVNVLRNNLPHWADDLPDDVWIMTEGQYQWMSWIQLKTVHVASPVHDEGEVDERLHSILVAQLVRFAGVEAEREAIVTYVQELLTLRQAVLAGAELPDEEDLDRFQKAVVQAAAKELEESQQ